MHKPILFLGGMCGDLVLKLIDQTSVLGSRHASNFADYKIKKARRLMKPFWKYSETQKDMYHDRFNKFPQTVYTITHDTDYCKKLDSVIQIYCSDSDKIHWLSKRFRQFNCHTVVERVCDQQGFDLDNFENQYTDLIVNWQNSFVFENRFDIKNINSDRFICDLTKHFSVEKTTWTEKIYKSWAKNQTFEFVDDK